MSAWRATRIVICVALAIVLAFATFVGQRWYVLHVDAARRVNSTIAVAEQPSPSRTRSVHSTVTSISPGETASKFDATAWLAQADDVIARKRARIFGAEDARLDALPPKQAWQQLAARADQGDVAAASLAISLAAECKRLRAMPYVTRYEDITRHDLSPAWRERLRAIDREADRRLAERVASCASVGNGMELASLMLDRLLQSDDPEAVLASVDDIEDDAEAIAKLRDLVDRLGTERARRALGERLLRASDAALSAEGMRLLLSLAAEDESLAPLLAHCYRNGCGAFGADPTAGAEWLERAAGDGDSSALQWKIDDAKRADDASTAWAWAMYRLQLAEYGCFEHTALNSVWLQKSAAEALQLDARLTPAQRATALEQLDALGRRWLASAEQYLDCAS